MALEPGGNRGFFAIREQIDQALTFQIQQDGAVLHSFPKRSGKGERRYRRPLP